MAREGALWIGGLEPYMDETFLRRAFHAMGEDKIVSIKVMRNKMTGEPANYGFVNFENDKQALLAMHKLNQKIIPSSKPPARFKLNHNSTRLTPGERDHSIWVGDLSPEVDDLQLYHFFAARFQTVKTAKVVCDHNGISKGFGFIRFGTEQEQQTAMATMANAVGLGSKPIKVSLAVPRAKMGGDMSSDMSGQPAYDASSAGDYAAQQHSYWQNYNQYWSQMAAYNTAPQAPYYDPSSYYGPPPIHGVGASAYGPPTGNEAPRRTNSSASELVDHNTKINVEEMNKAYFKASENLWDSIEAARWNTTEIPS